MRLLHTTTLELHEFFGSQTPYYAILSHRWGDGEVTFQDMKTPGRVHMNGWSKITGCCAQARSDGWEYTWIDSCCIDKSSSSELSEAINSMYQWYKNSQVCYAYLSDVPPDTLSPHFRGSPFRKSQWFTRGWTLQELLAPESLVFFDSTWQEIGTRSTLGSLVSSITDIDGLHLQDPSLAYIAQKMSWASRRKTLREEDMAYCLLGLFGVHMPLLYGEGTQAFLRLQIEIIKISDDESIFAWADEDVASFERCGMLAQSPAAFKGSAYFLSNSLSDPISGCEHLIHAREMPFLMTNKGLQISLSLLQEGSNVLEHSPPGPSIGQPTRASEKGKRYIAPLNCVYDDGEDHRNVVVRLESTSNGFSRVECDSLQFAKYPPGLASNSSHVATHDSDTNVTEKGGFVPQTIFVRDNRDRDFTFLMGVCETHLRIERLLQDGFVFSEKPFLTSKILADVSTHGDRDQILTVGGTFDSVQSRGGLVVFKFTSQAESFALLLCQWKASHGIELIYAGEDKILDNHIRRRLRSANESKDRLRDRAICLLESGPYVLASLKKGVYNGQIVSVVDFSIEAPSERIFATYLSSLEDLGD
ncbi:HET-domain-containing protein [Stipitochalara longipes BDJ]|nr:HET-domain-containing protein [Stipitochalara longipes BDJ]